MYITSLTLFFVLVTIIAIIFFIPQINFIKSVVFGLISCIGIYILISGILFWIDIFTLFLAVLICLITSIVLLVCAIIFNNIHKHEIKLFNNLNDSILLIIILLIAFFFSKDQFEIHGMGQDEGVYQVKAIALMEGYTKNQLDFEEYHLLTSEDNKERYYYQIIRQVGFDNYDSGFPTLDVENELSDVSGHFHGIPTYASLLALWATIFGLKNMMGIQIVAFLCAICLLWFILDLLKCKRHYKFLFTLLYALSPQVLWIAKSSLTEMILALIMLMFFYLTLHNNEKCVLASSLCVLVFSFYHVSAFTIMPYFFLLYLIYFIYTKNKLCIISGILSLTFFEVGLLMMANVSPTYTFNNITGSLQNIVSFINYNRIIPLSIICILICILIYVFVYKFIDNKFNFQGVISKFTIILISCSIAKIVYNIYDIYRELHSLKQTFYRLCFDGYMFSIGIIVGIAIIITMLIKTKYMQKDKNMIILLFSFGYLILFISAFLRTEVRFYYYYGRYFVPYISIILIVGATIWTVWYKRWRFLFIAASILLIIPFSFVMVNEKDDTRMNWEVLTDISDVIEDNSVIMFKQISTQGEVQIAQTLMLALKYMNDAYVYPQLTEVLERQFDSDEMIYYITDQEIEFGELLYSNIVYSSDDYQNDGTHGLIIPYTKSFTKFEYTIYVYGMDGSDGFYYYDYEEGFSTSEETHRWTDNTYSEIHLYLYNTDTRELCIYLGPEALEDISIDISVNGYNVENVIVKEGESNQIIKLSISDEILTEGKNILSFRSNTWRPSEYGSEDGRTLGFSIIKIVYD